MSCSDCFGSPGLREIALGYIDDKGIEHRRVWFATCGCSDGIALIERGENPTDKDGASGLLPCRRVTWRTVLDAFREALRRKGWQEVGWWVTSRDMRTLPREARHTPDEMVRVDAWAEMAAWMGEE